jgi:hypothetical protein
MDILLFLLEFLGNFQTAFSAHDWSINFSLHLVYMFHLRVCRFKMKDMKEDNLNHALS